MGFRIVLLALFLLVSTFECRYSSARENRPTEPCTSLGGCSCSIHSNEEAYCKCLKQENCYVLRGPPRVTITPNGHQEVNAGEGINITCSAVSFPFPRLFWISADQDVPNLNQNPFAFMSEQYLLIKSLYRTERFTCIAQNALGKVQRTVEVRVRGPGTPPILTALRPDRNAIHLRWDPPFVINNPLTRCSIHYSDDITLPVENWQTYLVSGHDREATIRGLKDNTEYFIRLRAFDILGPGVMSHPISVITKGPAISPNIRIMEGHEIIINSGQPFHITCNVTADPVPMITWLHGNRVLSKPERSTLSKLHMWGLKESTKFTCEATNEAGTQRKTVRVILKGQNRRPTHQIYPTREVYPPREDSTISTTIGYSIEQESGENDFATRGLRKKSRRPKPTAPNFPVTQWIIKTTTAASTRMRPLITDRAEPTTTTTTTERSWTTIPVKYTSRVQPTTTTTTATTKALTTTTTTSTTITTTTIVPSTTPTTTTRRMWWTTPSTTTFPPTDPPRPDHVHEKLYEGNPLTYVYPDRDNGMGRTQLRVLPGSRITISCNATGNPEPQTQWISHQKSDDLKFKSVAHKGQHYLRIYNLTSPSEFRCISQNAVGTSTWRVEIDTIANLAPDWKEDLISAEFDDGNVMLSIDEKLIAYLGIRDKWNLFYTDDPDLKNDWEKVEGSGPLQGIRLEETNQWTYYYIELENPETGVLAPAIKVIASNWDASVEIQSPAADDNDY